MFGVKIEGTWCITPHRTDFGRGGSLRFQGTVSSSSRSGRSSSSSSGSKESASDLECFLSLAWYHIAEATQEHVGKNGKNKSNTVATTGS